MTSDSLASICPSASAICTIHASIPAADGALIAAPSESGAAAGACALRAAASRLRASAGERTALSTHPRVPSLSAVPHDSHTPLVPPVCGAPQLGQCADEIALLASVLTPLRRDNSSTVRESVGCPVPRAPFASATNNVPDQRTSTIAWSHCGSETTPSVSTEPTAQSP